MKLLKQTAAVMATLGCCMSVANAQTATWSNPSINVGTATVDVTLDFDTMGVTVQGYGINTTYDNTQLVYVSCVSSATTCDDLGGGNSGTINIGSIGAPGANPIVTLTFNTAATPVGMYNIESAGATYVDAGFADQPLPVATGVINVTAGPQPAYTSTPTGGSTLTFGPALGGSGNLMNSLSISNTGDAGSSMDATCTLSGADAGQFSVSGGAITGLAMGASSQVDVTCTDPGIIGAAQTFNASLDCAHNASNVATPQSYPLSCTYNPPFANVVPTPANGTQRTILVPAIGGMGNTSVTFNESENNGVDGSIDTCSISGVDAAQFTITAPAAFPATVPAGGSVQVTVNGVEPGTGMPVAAALDCTLGDGIGGTTAVSFPLQFLVQPQVVPTLNQWAMILMSLFLAGVGFFTLRRKAQ